MAYGLRMLRAVFQGCRCRLLPTFSLYPRHILYPRYLHPRPLLIALCERLSYQHLFLRTTKPNIRSPPATHLSSHHITKTLGMRPSPTSSIVSNLSISAATAVSRSWDCACGPSCALFIDHRCASQSGTNGRLAVPGFWLLVITVLVCWFVLVSGNAASSPNAPQSDDAKASASIPATALPAVNEEPSSTIIYHLLAGRLLPEKVEVKPSKPEVKQAIDTTTNIPDKHPSTTRIAILLALFILSAMPIPMALAEITSTNMPPTSLTLPSSSSPSPCTTAFNAIGTVLSFDPQEKDKPQTWYWIPPNSADRASINSLLSLIPFLLMGFFLLLPSFVAGDLENVEGRSVPADTSPVWEIFSSTTAIWPHASNITESREGSSSASIEKPISVADNSGGCGPSAEVEFCTESNPAVCPIVLGRKPWTPA